MIMEIDGYRINYKITGVGDRSVLILQGWGTSLAVYDSVAAAISDSFRVVQLDLPGFGDSDEPREPWNVQAYADFVVKFVQELGLKSVSLIGHSYGGRVILKLAAADSLPFAIEKIAFVDSAGVLPKRSTAQKWKVRRYKLLKKILLNPVVHFLFPEVIDDWAGRQGSADYRAASPMMKQCLVMAVNEDLTDLMPKVKQDCLLVWGDRDTATPISDAHVFAEKLPSSGLAVIEGAGHYSFLEQPALFRSVLRSYFELGD
jgi:pimeloyl-ACP methyl ester carboxylesterase